MLMPNPLDNPIEWFRAVDVDGNGHLSFQEVLKGLETALEIDWGRISAEVDTNWGEWDPDSSGEISLEEFLSKSQGLIAYLKEYYDIKDRGPPPDITKDAAAWFRYWDEDSTESLDRGEVVRAMMKTLKIRRGRTDEVIEAINAVWPLFDTDGNGTISFDEFIERDGLADTIIAQLGEENGEAY
jgi:Ca2+-binding EF-hand superfamily protein